MFPVIENLRAFFNSRPPLVVFMICLASFAIALITFAYIVKTKDIPDSDVTEDWNSFLEKFSKIDLCFSQNGSESTFLNYTGGKLSTGVLSPSEIYQTLRDKFKEIDFKKALKFHKISTREVESSVRPEVQSQKTLLTPGSKGLHSVTAKSSATSLAGGETQFRNVSFVLNVEVVLSKDKLPHMAWSDTHFVTIVTGDMLKLKGIMASDEMMVTFTFPTNLSSSTCQTWDKGVCHKHVILACVQLQGPPSMFPNTQMPELSELCHAHHNPGEENPSLRFMVPTLPGTRMKKEMCQQGSHMSTYFSFDESLTVLLSLHDRSVINLRLMRTSYFLFVMVVTFLCYAMVKGKRAKTKTSHIPYVEKIPA